MTTPDYPIEGNVQFVDPDEIRTHLELLFAGVEWTPERGIGLRGIGEKGTPKESNHREDFVISPLYDGDHVAQIIHHATRWAQWHVATFIVPCALKGRRGTAENVELFSTVVVDLDEGNTDERLAWLAANVAPPTFVVASGGVTDCGTAKRHAYYQLTEPCADVGLVVRLRDVLARKAGGDISMGLGVEGNPYGRAHQPIRIAGTCHAKDGVAKACRFLSHDPLAVYDVSALALLIDAAQPSPWALEDKPVAAAVPSQGAFSFQPERASDTTRALNSDVYEGGSETTRFSEFSKVAGHYIHCARRGDTTVEQARDLTMGWMNAHMKPAWPAERAHREFDGILREELRRGGPIAPPEEPIVSRSEAALGLAKWAAHRWIVEPAPPLEFLVEGLVVKSEPHLFVSAGGAGKTYLAADLAMKLAAFGRTDVKMEWCGSKIMSGGAVVLILCEDSQSEMHRRFLHLDGGRGLIAAGGDRLIVLPMTSLGGAFPMAQKDPKTGSSTAGKKWNEIMGLLREVEDLKLVIIDTFNSVSHGEENSAVVIGEMMREAHRVCGELKAALLMNHHLRKEGDEPVSSLRDLKDSIRGSTAITSYFRVNFGMFPAPDYSRRMKAMGLKPEVEALWRFGIAKCNINGLMRGEKSLLRNAHGLLEDVTELDTFNDVNFAEREAWVLAAVRVAALAGHPYSNSKTGNSGLYKRRGELPACLQAVGPGEFAMIVDDALQRGALVLSAAKGSKTKTWLDVPGGPVADNDAGEDLVSGAYEAPSWDGYRYSPTEGVVVPAEKIMPVAFGPRGCASNREGAEPENAAPAAATTKRIAFSPERVKVGIERGLKDD